MSTTPTTSPADSPGAPGSPAADKPHYVPHRLPLPDLVEMNRIQWVYAIPIVIIHILALAVCVPWLFSWTGLITCILGVHFFGQGINLCYHRLLTHHSFEVPRWLEHVFVIIALCCLEDTPVRWVATHRFHHNYSDEKPDPHSPLVTFFWGHCGWLMVRNPALDSSLYRKYASDLLQDPFYMNLEKKPVWAFYAYVGHGVLYFLIGAAIALLTGGSYLAALQFGLSLLVWGVLLRTVIVWHITWSVNSLSHLFGYANYDTGENSKNNWLVAFLTVGEGWHNNHHHDAASASVQHRWWEIDITYYEILILEKLRLATRVIRPRHVRKAQRSAAD